MQLFDQFQKLHLENISDIYIQSNQSFYYKELGQIHRGEVLGQELITAFIHQNLSPQKYNELLHGIEQSSSFHYQGNFYRIHFFLSQNLPAIMIRILPKTIKNQMLFKNFKNLENAIYSGSGLFLISGSTGSGKTTSANAILDFINHEKIFHIVCIEDPIEYRHTNQKSIFTYREVGADTQSFHSGILSALRQDPDVIFVGELRQKEAIVSSLLASQTGHLVIATLHGSSMTSTILRFLSAFEDKASACSEIAESLVGILLQKRVGSKFYVDFLPATTAIKTLIKEQKFNQIHSQASLITQSMQI